MEEKEFSMLADHVLSTIIEKIETADVDGAIDLDFDSSIINISVGNAHLVINKHSAAKEVWLASSLSGPYHFAYDGKNWKSKSGVYLFDILKRELSIEFYD